MAKYVYSNGGVYEFETDEQVQEFSRRIGGDRVQQAGGGMWLFNDAESAKKFRDLQAMKPMGSKSAIGEMLRAAGRGAIRGGMSVLDLFSQTNPMGTAGHYFPEEQPLPKPPLPSQMTIEAIQGLRKPPETPQGKMTEEIVTGATGGMVTPGGPLAARAFAGGLAGMGGEVAANTMGDTPVNRVTGALLGQLSSLPLMHGGRFALSAMGGPSVRTPGIVHDHTKKIPERDWARAEELTTAAKENNIPLSPAQAFETQNPLHGLYERITNTPETASEMARFHGSQQQASLSRSQQFLDEVASRTEPQRTIGNIQEQASRTLEDYRKLRTLLTKDYYTPTRRATIPEVRAVYESLRQEAIRAGGESTDAGKAIMREAEKLRGRGPTANAWNTNAEVLQNIYLEGKAANKFGFSDSGLDRFVGGRVARAMEEHEDLLNGLMPKRPEGNALFQEFTERIYAPKKAGPVGKIAGRTGFEEDKLPPASRIQSALLDETNVGPQGIADAQRGLGFRFPQAVRMSIEKLFNTAAKTEGGFTSPTAAADFAASLAGGAENTAKRANFRAIMRGVARSYGQNEDEIARGAERLMDVLIASGRMRPRVSAEATGPATTADAIRTAGAGAGFHSVAFSAASRIVDRIFTGKSDQELMKILTSPDGLQQLRKLSKIDPLRFRKAAASGGVIKTVENLEEESQ